MTAREPRRIQVAAQLMRVMRGYAAVGIGLAVVLFVLSFTNYENQRASWICRVGGMGSLLGSVLGLNVMDRFIRGRSLPLGLLAGSTIAIVLGLMAVALTAMTYRLGAMWSPVVAAVYVSVLTRILWRLRSQSMPRPS